MNTEQIMEMLSKAQTKIEVLQWVDRLNSYVFVEPEDLNPEDTLDVIKIYTHSKHT